MEKLINYIEIISGGTPKTSTPSYWNGNIPWLSVKDFSNVNRYVQSAEKSITDLGVQNSATNILKKNDIIISARGTVGRIALIDSPMAFNQSCFGLRSKSNQLDQLYLYYWLSVNVKQLQSQANGGVFDTIIRSSFENIYITLPTIDVQHHIVDTIGTIDDLIENLNETKESLHKLMSAKLFLEECNLVTLDDYIDIYDNIRKPLSSMERIGEKTYPYYGATGVLDFVSNYIFDDEYVLLAEDGSVMTIEETPIVQYINGKTWVGNHAHVLKSKNGLGLYGLYFILKDTNVKNAVTGAVQMKINQANLKKLLIKLPMNLDDFNILSDSVMKKINNIDSKIKKLINLKQQYLKKFFG